MKVSSSLGSLALFLALSSTAAAWPTWLPNLDALVVRQEGGEGGTTSSPPPTQTNPPASTTSRSPNTQTTRNLNTATLATDADGKVILPTRSGSGNSSDPRPTEFDPRDPAGNVVMVTPAPLLGTNLYKIGDYVTWGWNYTNLQATPTAVNVLVSCSRNQGTWTLTSNMTFATAGSYTWDTKEQATAVQSPLLTEQYTLLIFDAESSVSATPEAGYLGTFSGFTFGMYAPQPYTPLNEWNCATCNAAMPSIDRKALGFALSMSLITVLSFTWFVTGVGLL